MGEEKGIIFDKALVFGNYIIFLEIEIFFSSFWSTRKVLKKCLSLKMV